MKIIIKIICVILIILMFTVSALAFSEQDTFTYHTSIEGGDQLLAYFYNSEYGDQNESIYAYEDFKYQKVKVVTYCTFIIPFNQAYSIGMEELSTSDVNMLDITFPDYNGSYKVYQKQEVLDSVIQPVITQGQYQELRIDKYTKFVVQFEYTTYIGTGEYSDSSSGFPISYSRHVDAFYPMIRFSDPNGVIEDLDSVLYYMYVTSAYITPVQNFVGVSPGSWVTCWYNSSFNTYRDSILSDVSNYQYDIRYFNVSIKCNGTEFEGVWYNYQNYINMNTYMTIDTKSSQYYFNEYYFTYIDRNIVALTYQTGIGSKYGVSSFETQGINKKLPIQHTLMYVPRNYKDADAGLTIVPDGNGTASGIVDVSRFYLDTRTNWFNYVPNFFIWLGLECPILSFITKPVLLVVLSAVQYYTSYVNPLLGGIGIFGSLITFVLLIALIKRISGLKND